MLPPPGGIASVSRGDTIQHSINTRDCPFHTVYTRNKPDIFHPSLSPAKQAHWRFYHQQIVGFVADKTDLKPELEVRRLHKGKKSQHRTLAATVAASAERAVESWGTLIASSPSWCFRWSWWGDLANGETPRCYHAANSSHSSGHQRRPTWSLAEQSSRPVSNVWPVTTDRQHAWEAKVPPTSKFWGVRAGLTQL